MLSISDILRVFRKHLWLFGALSVGFAIAAFLWSSSQPKLYDASAAIQVDQHGQLSLSTGVEYADDYDTTISTDILQMQSHDLALSVLKNLNLNTNGQFNPQAPKKANLSDPGDREFLVKRLLASLKISRIPKSEIISITARSKNPLLSAQIANGVVDAYLENNFRTRYEGSKDIKGWLSNELDELKSKVQAEQGELFKDASGLGLINAGEQGETSLYEQQLSELQGEMVKAQVDRFTAEAEYQNLEQSNGNIPVAATMPGAELLLSEQTQLAQVQSQEAALSDRYGSGYGPLKALKDQEAKLQKDLVERRDATTRAALGAVHAAEETERQLQKRIDAVNAQTKGMSPEAVRYQALKAQYQADQSLYNNLLQLLSQGGIQAGLSSQEVHRMSAADIPAYPSEPRVMRSTLAGFGIGFLLSGGIAIVLVALSDTVETMEQIEQLLPLPLIAAVPSYRLASPNSIESIALIAAPRSPAAEAYRILRTSIELIPQENNRQSRVIAVTSCGPGEGKTTTALNLAVSESQQQRRVLLIDCDLRKPMIAKRLLSTSVKADLPRLISDPSVQVENCAHSVEEIPGLFILETKEAPPFPSELLGQGRFSDLLDWARKHFDIVVIDTPPVLLVPDLQIIANKVDIILLVARVGAVQRRALRRVQHELSKFPNKYIALVANAVPHRQSYYGGYYKYREYYADESETKI